MVDRKINFALKTLRPGHHGMNMGLCPGTYEGVKSLEEALFVAEAAFGPLEDVIRTHSPAYAKPDAHYGVTPISRAEWLRVIDDWQAIRLHLQSGGDLNEKAIWWFTTGCHPERSAAGLDQDAQGLIGLIEELSNWLRVSLQTYDQVCVLGI